MTYKGFAMRFGSRNDETYTRDIVKRNKNVLEARTNTIER